MELRINRRVNGEYFIQKHVVFMWWEDCTDKGEIATLLSDGVVQTFYEFTEAVKEIGRLHKRYEDNKELGVRYTKGQKLDKTFTPREI